MDDVPATNLKVFIKAKKLKASLASIITIFFNGQLRKSFFANIWTSWQFVLDPCGFDWLFFLFIKMIFFTRFLKLEKAMRSQNNDNVSHVLQNWKKILGRSKKSKKMWSKRARMVAAKTFRYISNLETNNSSSRSKGKPFGSMMISIVTCKKSKKTNIGVFVLRKKLMVLACKCNWQTKQIWHGD